MPWVTGYTALSATDALQLSEQTREWNFEFQQLTRGDFSAQGGVLDLDGVSIASVKFTQTLLHRGAPPDSMVALLLSGPGSGPSFVNGQRVESGQCITMAAGEMNHGVTHGYYHDVACGFDLVTCGRQFDSLHGDSVGITRGTSIVAPGQAWIDDMQARVEWILQAAAEQPHALNDVQRRASLADHLLAALPAFDHSLADVDTTTRSGRAGRRIAVRRATDYIQSHLCEPVRLSELCRYAQLKIRSLEYGFREVTGLTPIAYVKSLRLNTVRRELLRNVSAQDRSISEIAMDAGFWHLSQFAVDYRLFFGETPTETRRRSLGKAAH